jgi:pimeloyl-ACP methyl ester carboxylesterase
MVDEQNIDIDGLSIRYMVAGEGPPLVLLHALGESAQDWRWVLPGLARTHRVYAPDLPGFGESNKPVADYSSSFFARFVAAFLDALKVERAVVAGSSLGGLVALHLALSEPSRVEALGLLRVPLFFARPDRVPTEWFEDHQRLTRLPGFLEAVIAALRAQGNFEVQREVLLDQLPQLQMPMLVIWGAYAESSRSSKHRTWLHV